MDASRREFFRHFIRHAQKSAQIPRTVPRPPTALSESEFLKTCNGCGNCVTACPNDIISIRNQVAELDLELSYCSHCHKCNEVCPTSALSHSVSDSSMRPKINSNCNPQTAFYCAECQYNCPVGAISVQKNNKPSVDMGLCNGCNQCGYNCPASAISIEIIN